MTQPMRRESMPKRIKELTPFSRYSRDEIELFAELVYDRWTSLLPTANRGDEITKTEAKRVKAIHAKLLDDLKMRP